MHSTPDEDPSFHLENTKSPDPESPGKFLKNDNLAHPGPVLKFMLKSILQQFSVNFLGIFWYFSGNFWGGPNRNFCVNFQDFRGGRDFVFSKGNWDPN